MCLSVIVPTAEAKVGAERPSMLDGLLGSGVDIGGPVGPVKASVRVWLDIGSGVTYDNYMVRFNGRVCPKRRTKLGGAQSALKLAYKGLRGLEDGLNGNGIVVLLFDSKSLVPQLQQARKLLTRSHCYRSYFQGKIALHNSKLIHECLRVCFQGFVKNLR